MKHIKSFTVVPRSLDFKNPALAAPGIIAISLLTYFLYMLTSNWWNKITKKGKEIVARGYIEQDFKTDNGIRATNFKFWWLKNYKNRYEIYPASSKTQSELENDIQFFSEVLNTKLVEIKKVTFWYWLSPIGFRHKIIAYKEMFPKEIPFNKTCPESLEPLQVFLGLDGQGNKVILDQKEASFGAILGSMGSGKSIALEAIIASHRKTNPKTKFIVSSSKPHQDYAAYKAAARVQLINTSNNEELKKLLESCIEVKKEIARRSEIIALADKRHASDVPGLFPICLIFDEANLSLNVRSAKADKERTAIIEQLVTVVDAIIRQGRFASVITWIGSQGDTIDEVDVNIKLANYLIVSRTNKQQSHNFFNSEISFDQSLRQGKFVLRSPEGTAKIIKTPFPVS